MNRATRCAILMLAGSLASLPSSSVAAPAAAGSAAASSAAAPAVAPEGDPFLWLEEIEGERSLDWVRARNAETAAEYESDPRFERFREEAAAILNASDRIPYASCAGDWVSNFWQDAEHVRGIWRRASLESYRTDDPDWETILDFDALSEAEGENWVAKEFKMRVPAYDRCLLSLSRGGKDAVVVREFDLTSKTFVEDGFVVPEAKSDVDWIDRDTIVIATDWGEGSLTESGYPRIVKRWRRGTPVEQAETLYEAATTDVAATGYCFQRPEGTTLVLLRSPTFFTGEYSIWHDGRAVRVPIPESAEVSDLFGGQLIVRLRDDWAPGSGGTTFTSGSLVSFPLARLLDTGELPPVEVVFAPDDRTTVEGTQVSRSHLWVTLLHEVKGQLLRFERHDGKWSHSAAPVPELGTVGVRQSNAFHEVVFLGYQDYLTPPRLLELDFATNTTTLLKSLPDRFDAKGLVVEQFNATSPDGERIPYFVVRREDLVHDGTAPTLLYGYGGFEISRNPAYYAVWGKLWAERGGVFVMACIRGGGEFGPRWHQAALREKRQVSYDDFYAIAEDLIARRITSAPHLGIMGGSQGGLLVGVAMTQRPELYGAVVCQVPLLDMLRYAKLLAGASWAEEYGDPADPAMREAILRWSPYQNVRPGVEYPSVLFVTSTKDDRVHPGHARKMAARLLDAGAPVAYHENIEGGHSASANRLQRARRNALEFVFLSRTLGLE